MDMTLVVAATFAAFILGVVSGHPVGGLLAAVAVLVLGSLLCFRRESRADRSLR